MNLIASLFMAVLAAAPCIAKICRTGEPRKAIETYVNTDGHLYLSHPDHVEAWKEYEEILGEGQDSVHIDGYYKIRRPMEIRKAKFITLISKARDESDGMPVTLYTLAMEETGHSGAIHTILRHFYTKADLNRSGNWGKFADIVEKSDMEYMMGPCRKSEFDEPEITNAEETIINHKSAPDSTKHCKADAKKHLNAICTNYCNKCSP